MLTLPLERDVELARRWGPVAPKTWAVPLACRSVSWPVMWTASRVAMPFLRLRRMGPALFSSMPWSLTSKSSKSAAPVSACGVFAGPLTVMVPPMEEVRLDGSGAEQRDGVADVEAGEGELGLGLVVAGELGLAGTSTFAPIRVDWAV